MLAESVGKASMIEHNTRIRPFFHETEAGYGIFSRLPALRPPGLHQQFIGDKLDVPAGDVAVKERKDAACFSADFGRLGDSSDLLHGGAEFHHLLEQLALGEDGVDLLPARLKNRLLMDSLSRVGNAILGCPNS